MSLSVSGVKVGCTKPLSEKVYSGLFLCNNNSSSFVLTMGVMSDMMSVILKSSDKLEMKSAMNTNFVMGGTPFGCYCSPFRKVS